MKKKFIYSFMIAAAAVPQIMPILLRFFFLFLFFDEPLTELFSFTDVAGFFVIFVEFSVINYPPVQNDVRHLPTMYQE